MTSIDSTSSSQLSANDDHKRTIDEAFLNKMKLLVERLRLENSTFKKSLDIERSEVRALKAQHDSTLRNLKTEHKKREEILEKQLRNIKPEKEVQSSNDNDIKRLTIEIQSLKAANKGLQEKVKVAQEAECARAAELRAQAAKYAALELAAHREARAQCHKLLEEIKSKERIIIQLRREMSKGAPYQHHDQTQKMEGGAAELSRKLRVEQGKEKSNRENFKTDIQHRKQSFYRETPSDEDSAVSSAPASLSPQPHNDMWACGQCRAASERANAAARECTRLADALRDARDQLELMEFRILELEDASPDKGVRDSLTDTDSGCVSPGSRIKDSASPELKRMDSGYKSPTIPSSPCNSRRTLDTTHEDFKEEFAKAQVLADILDRNSETSDSLRSNPMKDHLEQMILNAGSTEDRSCLEQVLMLLYNYQALSSSVSEDECYQTKPKKICDLKLKETVIPSSKTQKAIATVTPYSQKGFKCESLESICSEERKPSCVLQESGIFEEVETETRCTQTDSNDSFECTGELNTEIQRLNSIREKLEKQGVRSRTLNNKEEADGLECKCVKLGKKHKQYYERRLKFLEGKISIYEAAQDVKEAKLAERLQKEFQLENRIQDLESQLIELQDKYEKLEEECCELEEIENDTRLHWQQLEMDYELCSAQLRDMTEQRECSRAQAERLVDELSKKECVLKAREAELQTRLTKLERAVPALIAWNVCRAVGAVMSPGYRQMLLNRMGPLSVDAKAAVAMIKNDVNYGKKCTEIVAYNDASISDPPNIQNLQKKVTNLLAEKHKIEAEARSTRSVLEAKVRQLEEQLETAKRQVQATMCSAAAKQERLDETILDIEAKIRKEEKQGKNVADSVLNTKIRVLIDSENMLKSRIAELEKRETAYLEMLTQADDMWAEMEGGYKKKIEEAKCHELKMAQKIKQVCCEKDELKKCLEPIKSALREAHESESAAKIALEKAERDAKILREKNVNLSRMFQTADAESRKADQVLRENNARFRYELEDLRRMNRVLESDLRSQKEFSELRENKLTEDLGSVKKQLNKCAKQTREMEVTNSELREEVESLEKQLALTQKALNQCKKKCDENIKTLSHELSIKTEELEELRSETLRHTYHASRVELKPDRTEYVDEGYPIYTAVPKKTDYGKMHHSLSYITSESRCSCPSMRSQLVSQLIEDLFERIHNTDDDDLTRLCRDIKAMGREVNADTKAKITNYLLMAISKELVRSIGDADAKTDTEEWQRAVSSMTYSVPNYADAGGDFASLRLAGNAGVLHGAARLASVSCACAAARLCAAAPELADSVKSCQEEVLDHGDVKIMEEQLANAIESIVNCPSCALGTNAIVWSTDV